MVSRSIKKMLLLIRELYCRFNQEGCAYRAAALAYASLLTIIPIIILFCNALSYFPVFTGIVNIIQQFIVDHFLADSAWVMNQALLDFLNHIQGLSLWNLFFLVLVVLLMMHHIKCAFNAIWHVQHRRHFSISFVVYCIVLFISPIVLGMVLILGNLSIQWVSLFFSIDLLVSSSLLWLFSYCLMVLLFTVFNWVIPGCSVRFVDALMGGVMTTILFECSRWLFSVYITSFSNYRLLYGGLSAIPMLLVWLNIAWMIVLMGALITKILSNRA